MTQARVTAHLDVRVITTPSSEQVAVHTVQLFVCGWLRHAVQYYVCPPQLALCLQRPEVPFTAPED